MPVKRSSHPWVGCVRIPDFPVQAELARRPELRGRPVVITAPTAGGAAAKAPVTHCSLEAAEQGVRPGMPVREVIATCRQAVLLSADPEWYQKVHDAFLDALEQEAPAVEDADLGLAYVDLTGMERLYPQVDQLLERVVEAARERGLKAFAAGPEPEKAFDVRAAAGPNKFVACIAALAAPKEKPWIVLPYEARRFLAPHASSHLPVSDESKRRLALFGLERLGQIAELDPSSMQAQFGAEGRLIWELARGIDSSPLVPRRPFRPIAESLSFPAPVNDWTAFWVGIRQLITRVWQRRERGEKTVRQLVLSARIDEEVWEKSITFHEPVGDPEKLQAMLRRRLEGTELPGAVSAITLKLTLLGGAYVGQEALFPGSGQRLRRLKEALNAVKARYGTTGLYRIAEVEPWSRIPERRYALISFEP